MTRDLKIRSRNGAADLHNPTYKARNIPIVARHRAAMFADMRQLSQELTTALVDATAEDLRVAMPRGEYLAWLAEGDGIRAIGGAEWMNGGRFCRARNPAAPSWSSGRKQSSSTSTSRPPGGVAVSAEADECGAGGALPPKDSPRTGYRVNEGRRLYERLGFTPTNEMRLTTDGPLTEGRPDPGQLSTRVGRDAAPRPHQESGSAGETQAHNRALVEGDADGP